MLLDSIELRMASYEYIIVCIQKTDSREGVFVMFFALSFRRSVSFHQSRLSPTNNTNNAHRSPFSLYYCLLSSSPPFYILAWLGVVLKECRRYEKRQSNIRPREKNEILQGHFCQFEHD